MTDQLQQQQQRKGECTGKEKTDAPAEKQLKFECIDITLFVHYFESKVGWRHLHKYSIGDLCKLAP